MMHAEKKSDPIASLILFISIIPLGMGVMMWAIIGLVFGAQWLDSLPSFEWIYGHTGAYLDCVFPQFIQAGRAWDGLIHDLFRLYDGSLMTVIMKCFLNALVILSVEFVIVFSLRIAQRAIVTVRNKSNNERK